jgi:hypothetical protein
MKLLPLIGSESRPDITIWEWYGQHYYNRDCSVIALRRLKPAATSHLSVFLETIAPFLFQ